MKKSSVEASLLTLTEVGIILYWLFAALVAIGFINVAPETMYSDFENPIVVAWNWSFFPLDILFAVLGLLSRYGGLTVRRTELLSVISLSLMFCAGLMALSFWTLTGDYDPTWWAMNSWLLMLAGWVLVSRYRELP